jgi:hypothetical protein
MLLTRPAALLALVLGGCACAAPAVQDAGLDAGRDAGHDAGRDASRPDASRDAGFDAADDAARDGGPNDPEWVRLGGQPDGVDLYVARHPERVLRVRWEACGEGCLRAECPGTCGWLGGFVDAARRVAWIQTPEHLQTAVLLDVERGEAIAAWKLWDVEEPRAEAGAPAYGGGRVAISAYAYRPDGARQLSTWSAPVERAWLDLEPTYTLDVRSSLTITGNFVSATHQAWWLSPTAHLFLRNAEGTLRAIPAPRERGMVQSAHLVGDRVYYELWADSIRVWTATVEEAPSVLIDASPGVVRDFRTDGRTMVWYQGYDYDPDTLRFGRLELWTAPLVARAEDLEARRVPARVRGLILPVLGGSWVAMQGEGPTMDVFDLRDGSRRNWAPPEGGNVGVPPLYATEEEILVATTVGVFRIDPRLLPVVEPGGT